MKKIQNIAAYFFIAAVIVLCGISILGIWDFFASDVIVKSSQTLGLLALVSIIVMVAGRFMDTKSDSGQITVAETPDPTFKKIRRIVLIVLITGVSILAITGVLTIWNVIADNNILYKSLSSVGIMAFGSFLIVMTCLDRESSSDSHKRKLVSVGPLILVLIVVALIFIFSRAFS